VHPETIRPPRNDRRSPAGSSHIDRDRSPAANNPRQDLTTPDRSTNPGPIHKPRTDRNNRGSRIGHDARQDPGRSDGYSTPGGSDSRSRDTQRRRDPISPDRLRRRPDIIRPDGSTQHAGRTHHARGKGPPDRSRRPRTESAPDRSTQHATPDRIRPAAELHYIGRNTKRAPDAATTHSRTGSRKQSRRQPDRTPGSPAAVFPLYKKKRRKDPTHRGRRQELRPASSGIYSIISPG